LRRIQLHDDRLEMLKRSRRSPSGLDLLRGGYLRRVLGSSGGVCNLDSAIRIIPCEVLVIIRSHFFSRWDTFEIPSL